MAIDNLEQLEQSIGLESGKLAEMISSEETHTIAMDDYVIKPKSDYDSYIENVKKEHGKATLEIAIKNKRKDLGLEFEGKTLDNLLKFYGEKVEADAKIDPNKKYDTLKSDFEKVQGNVAEWEQKYSDLEKTYKQKDSMRTIETSIMKEIPDNTILPKEDILALIKSRTQFNIGEEGLEIIKNGEVQKNESTRNLTTMNEYMKSFITPYLKEVDGGAGGRDSSGNAKEGSFEMFEKQMEAKGISVGSEAYSLALTEGIKKGTIKM